MTTKDLPTPATLRKLLSYDPDTGLLTWRRRPPEMFTGERYGKAWNSRYAGRPAFVTATRDGYRCGRIFEKSYFAHRVAYAIHYGAWPRDQVDHISGVKTDNRIANLRDVSRTENLRNAAKQSNNTSGVCGVYWHKNSGKWRGLIRVNGKLQSLGYFEDFGDAVVARKAAEVKYGFHPNPVSYTHLTLPTKRIV